MNVFRKVVLYFLLLVALCVCSTVVIKIFDAISVLNNQNIWTLGFKVGFTAWFIILLANLYKSVKSKEK